MRIHPTGTRRLDLRGFLLSDSVHLACGVLFRGLAIGALLPVVAGCGGDQAVLLDPRRPEAEGGPVHLDSLPPSVVHVPVEVSLEPLVRIVERELPLHMGNLEERRTLPDNDRIDVAFELDRDSIEARFTATGAELRTILAYRVRAWYDAPVLPEVSASCGTGDDETRPRLRAAVRSPLTLDRDWNLRSRVEVTDLSPASEEDRDRCTITVFDFDVTEQVTRHAREAFEEVGHRADSAIAAIDVQTDFESWWETISRPVRLAEDVWLVLSPDQVGRDEIVGEGDRVSTRMSVRIRPGVLVGPEPPSSVRPLPPLEARSVDRDLSLTAESVASWGEVTRRVARVVEGRRFRAMGRSVRVEGLEVWGVGDGRLALGVDLSGDVRGTVYLVGTPIWNRDTNMISIPDLDFDLRTRHAILAGAAWLAEMGFVSGVKELASWDGSAAREWARSQVQKGFNARISSRVRLEGDVSALTITGVTATSHALHIRARVDGNATLFVEPGGS